ncbi:lysis system i-spanin subunit Rz [Pseudomonas vancouverensis]|uniref:Lysis protein n=1 Tax=Pseudomonas vancouverensis TaxID=95300 RepID=A0A1H2N9I5_PSEVA|nr:lysis system i-spanin subunit Rz [Pseudomonas vancouverensis]KAB0494030.1 lysis protein [Pseudomonas vancouverensis]TDB61467.1 lysis protein [Pseudomonas vancouverensis]SDV01821.1 Bacteriophage Rz lysis protein [Pseudomonas vancouverensis]
MSVLDLIPPPVRPWAVALVLMAIAGASAAGAWKVQDWRYGQQLAEKAGQADQAALKRAEDAMAKLAIEQAKRLALEARLKTNDETHHKELSDAKTAQQRVSDDLATAHVRLSVILAAGFGSVGGNGLSATASAGGVVHGGTRAELEPAHAQRIIGITDAGDRGLIALAACQGYVRELSR